MVITGELTDFRGNAIKVSEFFVLLLVYIKQSIYNAKVNKPKYQNFKTLVNFNKFDFKEAFDPSIYLLIYLKSFFSKLCNL